MLQPTLFDPIKLVSAKRTRNERQGVHSWHPYYAGYAEAFVESAIDFLGTSPKGVILDPWNGSGTTNIVASRLGICSIGCEVNPVMNVFASAKQAALLKHKNEINQLVKSVLKFARAEKTRLVEEDPLLEFMTPQLVGIIRSVYSSLGNLEYPEVEYGKPLRKFFRRKVTPLNPFQAFLTAALFVLARSIAGYKPGSNPTWIKSSSEKPTMAWKDFEIAYQDKVAAMFANLDMADLGGSDELTALIVEADSRRLPLSASTIDGVITSPPYLTRIDYAISVKPELLIMSSSEHFRSIRENTIGAPVIVDKDISIADSWGATCCDILRKVEGHKTKAARSYYLPNMLQYFRDMELSLSEINRVLKPGMSALIVVQSSFFKEVEIPLGEIYVEMIEKIGAVGSIVSREVVRGHLAHVNTRSNGYRSAKVYYEDVIQFEKVN